MVMSKTEKRQGDAGTSGALNCRFEPAHWRKSCRWLAPMTAQAYERIVGNNNSVAWKGRRFQIPQQPQRF
jgi:hypothetical protein